MAGIFTKRIWQPCICHPNELKREIKKINCGGQAGGQAKIWGNHGPPRPSLRIVTGNPWSITMSDLIVVSQYHSFVMIHYLMVLAQLALHYMRALW